MTLPEKFAARVLSELGPEEGAALCAALDTEPPVSVRLNPAKCAGAAEPGAVQDGPGAAQRSRIRFPATPSPPIRRPTNCDDASCT